MQLRWFTNQAVLAARARAAAGVDDADASTWGAWVAAVQRPPEALRGRYQLQLATAVALIDAGCPVAGPPASPTPAMPPPATGEAPLPSGSPVAVLAPAPPGGAPPVSRDATAPALAVPGFRRQRLTRSGVVRVRLRCPAEACRVTGRGRVSVAGVRGTLRLRSVLGAAVAGERLTLALRLTPPARRAVARALRRGAEVSARLLITARDATGNATVRTSVVRLV